MNNSMLFDSIFLANQHLQDTFLLLLTLGVFLLATTLQKIGKGSVFLNPIIVSVVIVGAFLHFFHIDYAAYFNANQIIHFFLGPATVALAVPLYYQITLLKKMFFPIAISLCLASTIAAITGVMIARYLGASIDVLIALAPKSVTAPVALGIADQLGGESALTVTLVVLTGMCGLIVGPIVFWLLNIKDNVSRGLAMGIISHGMGVAYSYQNNHSMGVYAGLAMVLSAMLTAIIIPVTSGWLF